MLKEVLARKHFDRDSGRRWVQLRVCLFFGGFLFVCLFVLFVVVVVVFLFCCCWFLFCFLRARMCLSVYMCMCVLKYLNCTIEILWLVLSDLCAE